jgi:hypothetical protein
MWDGMGWDGMARVVFCQYYNINNLNCEISEISEIILYTAVYIYIYK